MHYRNVVFVSTSTLSMVNAMLISNQNSSFELNMNYREPIDIIGSKFFSLQTEEQFFLKDLTYQPIIAIESWDPRILNSEMSLFDPLAVPFLCLGDLKFFEKLNVNIRKVYSVDSERNEEICREVLANGMYVLEDLEDLAERDQPILMGLSSYHVLAFKRDAMIVSVMQKYPNILEFFVRNEVTNNVYNTDAPFIKAAIEDIEGYIRENKHRQIVIEHSSSSSAEIREYFSKYFDCHSKGVADFHGTNMYELCGFFSYVNKSYGEATLKITNHPISIFFSKVGCNAIRARLFAEIDKFFGPEISKVFFGNFTYMYFEVGNKYVSIKIDRFDSAHELEDSKYLQDAYSNIMSYDTTEERYLQYTNFGIFSKFTQCLNEVPNQQAGQSWKVSRKLPAIPNPEKYHCLEQHPKFLVTSSLSGHNFQDNFDCTCSPVDCSGIAAQGEKERRSEFSYCLPEQKMTLEISKIYNTENCPVRVYPMHRNNVLFDRNGNVTDVQCVEAFQKLKLRKNKPRIFDIDSGSCTTRFKHSGYALLLVSFIFATIVF